MSSGVWSGVPLFVIGLNLENFGEKTLAEEDCCARGSTGFGCNGIPWSVPGLENFIGKSLKMFYLLLSKTTIQRASPRKPNPNRPSKYCTC